ncbi:hypothetical protein [Streptomyces mirabilis]|uniref:hypothetical protein n=1 Tax=Streptomyces mirabilis TaxID=68239 RepID=UPI0036DF8844
MIDPMDINLPEFLTRWCGPPDVSVRQIPSDFAWIPHQLKEWYSLVYRWEKIRSTDNQVYKPRQIRVNQGKVEFAADPTGDWFWAFDVEDSNSVYEAELRGEWRLVPESLSEFLVHVTLREAAGLANFGRTCSQVPDECLPRVLRGVEEIAFGGWGWPRSGHRMFMSESVIMDVGPAMDFKAPRRNREGFFSVRVSGISSETLGYLDEISPVKWLVYPDPENYDS